MEIIAYRIRTIKTGFPGRAAYCDLQSRIQ
jgi:hypothetical protein